MIVPARRLSEVAAPETVSAMFTLLVLASRMLTAALRAIRFVVVSVTLITPSVIVPPDWPSTSEPPAVIVAAPSIVQLPPASTSTSPSVVVMSPVAVCVIVSVAIRPTSPLVLVIRAVCVMSSADVSSTSPFTVVTTASSSIPLMPVALSSPALMYTVPAPPVVSTSFTSTSSAALSVICPVPESTSALITTSLPAVPPLRACSNTSPVPLAETPVVAVTVPPSIVIVPFSATSLIGPLLVVVRSSRVSLNAVVPELTSTRYTLTVSVFTVIAPPPTSSRT